MFSTVERYPPDLQDAAVQNVLQQAEALSAEWAA
jgi:type I restriction enzyme R subunit